MNRISLHIGSCFIAFFLLVIGITPTQGQLGLGDVQVEEVELEEHTIEITIIEEEEEAEEERQARQDDCDTDLENLPPHHELYDEYMSTIEQIQFLIEEQGFEDLTNNWSNRGFAQQIGSQHQLKKPTTAKESTSEPEQASPNNRVEISRLRERLVCLRRQLEAVGEYIITNTDCDDFAPSVSFFSYNAYINYLKGLYSKEILFNTMDGLSAHTLLTGVPHDPNRIDCISLKLYETQKQLEKWSSCNVLLDDRDNDNANPNLLGDIDRLMALKLRLELLKNSHHLSPGGVATSTSEIFNLIGQINCLEKRIEDQKTACEKFDLNNGSSLENYLESAYLIYVKEQRLTYLENFVEDRLAIHGRIQRSPFVESLIVRIEKLKQEISCLHYIQDRNSSCAPFINQMNIDANQDLGALLHEKLDQVENLMVEIENKENELIASTGQRPPKAFFRQKIDEEFASNPFDIGETLDFPLTILIRRKINLQKEVSCLLKQIRDNENIQERPRTPSRNDVGFRNPGPRSQHLPGRNLLVGRGQNEQLAGNRLAAGQRAGASRAAIASRFNARGTIKGRGQVGRAKSTNYLSSEELVKIVPNFTRDWVEIIGAAGPIHLMAPNGQHIQTYQVQTHTPLRVNMQPLPSGVYYFVGASGSYKAVKGN